MHFQKRTFANSMERLAYLSQTRFDYVHFEISVPHKAQRPALAPLSNSLNSGDGVDCLPTGDLEAKPASDDDGSKPPKEILDEEDSTPANSAVQLFDESSERYVAATSLDSGSIQRQFEFETVEDMDLAEFFMEPEPIPDLYLDNFFMENEDGIPTTTMPSDQIMPEVVHRKFNGVEHDKGFLPIWADNVLRVPQFAFQLKLCNPCKDYSNIVVDDFKGILRKSAYHIDTIFSNQRLWNRFPFNPTVTDLCVWDPEISYMFITLTGSTKTVEGLLLVGSTSKFCLVAHSNSMTTVWDPGREWCSHAYILQFNSIWAVTTSPVFHQCYNAKKDPSSDLTELKLREMVLPWRQNLRVLLFALHDVPMVQHMDKDTLAKYVLKVCLWVDTGQILKVGGSCLELFANKARDGICAKYEWWYNASNNNFYLNYKGRNVDAFGGNCNFVGSDDEKINAEESECEDKAGLDQKIGKMDSTLNKLKKELRKVVAREIALYSVLFEHGSFVYQLHASKNTVSALVLISIILRDQVF
ncbi:hypothetical protein A4A49_11284 [Nicotiana attenuata]|uniref:Uncharacterized protein n=1 Tax=Nicotiana attenuata TaxID=49451 RepID=A0A314KPN0_NICAT|nr:hypothetical protein A4A49_11284 [Nicotiana attenuata]